MSGLPASILGLADRGTVEVGRVADLVLFDPTRVADRSTYQDPTLAPAGVELVTVDGRVVVERGEFTGLRAGRTLRPATRAAAIP
jgi:N-acyl-D-aspartate/D-glutamate deacylase